MLEFTFSDDATNFDGAASVLTLVTSLMKPMIGDGEEFDALPLDEDSTKGLWHILDMAAISLGQASMVAQARNRERAELAQTKAELETLRDGGKGAVLAAIMDPSEFAAGFHYERGYQAALAELRARPEALPPVVTSGEEPIRQSAAPKSGPESGPVPSLTEPAPEAAKASA